MSRELRLPSLLPAVDRFLTEEAGIRTGLNKREELKRLICEILLREDLPLEGLKSLPGIRLILESPTEGRVRFDNLKDLLLKMRYPESSRTDDPLQVYLPRLSSPGSRPARLSHPFSPGRLMIQENAFDSELSRRLRQAWPEIPAETFIRLKDIRFDKARMTGDMGKRDLYVVEEAFDIVKPCPCTAGALPCGYVILNLGFGCPYDCSYCYLQHYSNFPGILLPANLDVFFEQAAGLLESKGRIRVGTGEFCDSLALDPWTGYAGRLLEFVRDKDILFEFKTKSANVDALLAVPASPNVVAGWSLNPPELAESEELYAATVEERLEAASRAVRHGYHVAFHFDPIIPYAGWEQAYTDLVARMFSVARGRIAWISLGCLRFYRGLKLVAEQRFPEDPHLYGEFLLDPIDNKMRYPSHLREKVFKHMLELIRSADPAVPVYLCMEDERMWARVFGHDLTPIQVEADLTRPLR